MLVLQNEGSFPLYSLQSTNNNFNFNINNDNGNSNNNNNDFRGADPLRPMWGYGGPVTTDKHGIHLDAELLPVSGSPHPRFLPYAVRPFHAHGAPAYERYSTGGLDVAEGKPN